MPRDNTDLDPSLLTDLDDELRFVKETRRNKYMPRVNVDKGTAWLVRFLPIQIGTNNSWFGRVAQHWVNNRPIFCRRWTSEPMGGSANYDCPICAFLEKAQAHQSKEINDRAARCLAEPKWFTVCLVFGKDFGRSQVDYIKPPECWTAYECSMFRGTFEQLTLLYKRNAKKDTQGILDLYTGMDIWISRTGRGTTLLPDTVGPLVPAEAGWTTEQWAEATNTVVDKVWKTIILPEVTMPTSQQEAEQLLKVKEFVVRGSSGASGDSRGGRGGGAPPPPRSHPAQDLMESDGEPGAESHSESSFDLPPTRTAAPTRPAAPAAAPAAQPARPTAVSRPTAPPAAPPARPSAAKPSNPPAAAAPLPARPTLPTPAAPTQAALPIGGSRSVDPEDEEQNTPPERVDMAPPQSLESLESPEPAEPAEPTEPPAAAPSPAAPPPVGAAGTTRLGSKLAASLSRMSPTKA